jgi:imidazolonepropionase-like amidohydrolase
MEALQEAGLAPMEVIVASTRNGARAMRRDDIGTIATGNVADLVVLSADPLVDVRNVRRVERVVRRGMLHERAALEWPER